MRTAGGRVLEARRRPFGVPTLQQEDGMTRITRSGAEHPHPDSGDRRQLGEQLLDMVRQWAYSRVIRRANYGRHLHACRRCYPGPEVAPLNRHCPDGRALYTLMTNADAMLEQLRDELAELDRREPAPVPAPAATLFD